MNAPSFPTLAREAPAYVTLQRQMHDALLAQHPEWILPNGNCPKCDDYDRRFAELLMQAVPTRPRGLKQGNTHQSQYNFQYQPRVTTTHYAQ